MSVVTVCAQLAVLEGNITGVTYAYPELPRGDIPDANLPAMINFVREATYDWTILGSDMDREERTYLLQILVMPTQLGIPGEGEEKVKPFIGSVLDYFKSRPQLGQQAGIQDAIITGDSGARQIAWGSVTYWGCEFKMRVREYQKRAYADYE